MIPVIGVTGPSNVGKTTLLVKLIEELKNRGRRVAAIKHTTHKVDVDQKGKDSTRLHQAGAGVVALAGAEKLAVYMDVEEPWTPAEIAARLFPQVDVVIVEGYSDAPIPKIAVLRKGVAEAPKNKKGLIAIVADFQIESKLPAFAFDQVQEIADLIETYIKRKGPKRDAALFVDDRRVFIKPFIKDFFMKTIAAMVDSLKGTQDAQRIQITIDKPEGEPEQD